MIIASILRTKGGDVVHVRPDQTVHDVIKLLHDHRIGAVLVIDNDEVIGVLSERDIVLGLHSQGVSILDSTVAAIMSTDLVTVEPDESCAAAMGLMTTRRIRHLPVLSGGRLVGLVSIGDLVKNRIEEIEQEAALLKDYITAG